jgi:hypothetical protein
VNRPGQHPGSQPFDIQILDSNQVICVDDLPGYSVLKVRPLVLDMLVYLLKDSDCLPSPVASLLPAGYFSLRTSECGLSFTVVAGVVDNRAVAQDSEALKPNINSSEFSGIGHGLRGRNLDAEAGIPAAYLSLESECLNLARHRAVELELQASDSLNVELPVITELAAIAVAGESVAVETTPGLEPGESSFLPSLDPAKEGLKGLIHPAQHVLSGGVVSQAEITSRPNRFELIGLLVVVERLSPHAPGIPALPKASVVEAASFGQLPVQGLGLLPGWIKAVFESLAHLSAFLRLDVSLYGGRRDVAHTPDVVRTAPESRETGAQVRELLSKEARAKPLELGSNMCRRSRRVRLHKQVNLVWHNLQSVNCSPYLSSFGFQKLFQPSSDSAYQQRLAVLGAPHQVIFQGKNRPGVAAIARIWHKPIFACC